jgi:hypothetical protein
LGGANEIEDRDDRRFHACVRSGRAGGAATAGRGCGEEFSDAADPRNRAAGARRNDIWPAGRGSSERLGRQVVVDNRAGAEGMIGTEIVARANPDGYTLLMTSTAFTMNPAVIKKFA